jgi:hypothetical protein
MRLANSSEQGVLVATLRTGAAIPDLASKGTSSTIKRTVDIVFVLGEEERV